MIEYDEEKLIFLTGNGNKWFTKTDEKGDVYLGYEGKRKDSMELRLFQHLYWFSLSNNKASLCYVAESRAPQPLHMHAIIQQAFCLGG